MATVFRTYECLVADEASFLESANSLTSSVFDERVPVLDCRVELNQGRAADGTVQSRKNASRPGYRTLRDAAIEFDCYVPGAMTDPGTGAPTENWFSKLLGNGIGSSLITDDGGTVNSSTDADTFVTTGVTTITAGSIIRVGTKGDGYADGQPGVVDTWSGGNTQLLTALPGTPQATNAVRTCLNTYPTEANPTTSYRFCVMHNDTGAFYQLLGCRLESVSFEIPIADGGPIRATMRFRAAYWDMATPSSPSSFPSSVTLPNCDTAVIGGGSLYKQAFGTTTRAVIQPSTLTLTLAMGLIPSIGPAAAQPAFCNIYGWTSTGCVPTLTYSIPYADNAESEFDADGSSTTYQHFLFASGATAGRVFAFYMPRAFPVGMRPTRTDSNGLLYQTFSYQGTESTTTTSELTRSAIRFAQG